MASISGIYTITNLTNNKTYVGCTSDFEERFYTHKSNLRRGKHPNIFLQRAFTKDGEKNFVFEILEEWDIEFLATMEHFWVNQLQSTDKNFGYNLKPTHPYGKTIQSDETKLLISIAKTGTKRTDNCWVGRKHSEKSKEKMRIAKLGKKLGPYNVEKKVKIKKERIIRKGWKHTPEAIEKIKSRSNQVDNIVRFKEVQKLAAQSRIGTFHTEETKLKISMSKRKNKEVQIG